MQFLAQGTVTEKVSGNPVVGVTVVTQVTNPDGSAGPQLTAVTDSNGNYSSSAPTPSPLPVGNYTGDSNFAGTATEQGSDSGPEVEAFTIPVTVTTLQFTI
jgi:uncharacterized protein YfaS (alpha-2-macroglobulin family)